MTFQIPKINVKNIQFHILNMHTRFPFQYGIASLTAIPHLFLRVSIELDGNKLATGLTSEGLPPKWFTKNPNTHFEEDLPHFFEVIQHAANSAIQSPEGTFFEIWQNVQSAQDSNEFHPEVAPLLANLGVALVERAIIDAVCRGSETNLHLALQQNILGIDLGAVRANLSNIDLPSVVAKETSPSVHVRHTIGLGDPLDINDLEHGESLKDGLPFTLEENIREYGLKYFKIKVRGNLDVDLARLKRILKVLENTSVQQPMFTLDGNESFQSLQEFQEFYAKAMEDSDISKFLDQGLLFIEQPLHRSVALSEDLNSWADRPPIVLDESDGDMSSLPTALELGYQGCSHKNCKGIVKSLANAALLQHESKNDPKGVYLLSGEDLANVGPVALNQDLAMVASLGVSHVERNGHHYFRGLSMFPEKLWDTIGEKRLYRTHYKGFPTLDIIEGMLDLSSVNQAPFGTTNLLDSTDFVPLEEWASESMG